MKNKAGKVLIAAPVHPVLIEGLKKSGCECIISESIKQAEAYELIKDCVGVITSTRIQLDKELINEAPLLAWIGRMGSGMEVIDVEYAAAKGILCYSSPEGNCNAVGEHALGMLLSLIRHIGWSNREIQQGIWKREENRGIELEGKSIGIIGYGHTGSAFAKKMKGFDMRIFAYDRYSTDGIPPHIIKCNALDELMEEVDIVSFHVPLQKDTHHYFNGDFIKKMRKPFILINTSRGTVVDTEALYTGILDGKVIGACLDVFEKEPMSAMTGPTQAAISQMMQLPNVILTPHIAGYTHEALYKMSKILLDKIVSE